MEHCLKILPEYFKDVISQKKTFEIRKNDRDFKVGDTLELREFKNGTNTGNCCRCTIVYVLDNPIYFAENYVGLGIIIDMSFCNGVTEDYSCFSEVRCERGLECTWERKKL